MKNVSVFRNDETLAEAQQRLSGVVPRSHSRTQVATRVRW